jgi:hypothetical protein
MQSARYMERPLMEQNSRPVLCGRRLCSPIYSRTFPFSLSAVAIQSIDERAYSLWSRRRDRDARLLCARGARSYICPCIRWCVRAGIGLRFRARRVALWDRRGHLGSRGRKTVVVEADSAADVPRIILWPRERDYAIARVIKPIDWELKHRLARLNSGPTEDARRPPVSADNLAGLQGSRGMAMWLFRSSR